MGCVTTKQKRSDSPIQTQAECQKEEQKYIQNEKNLFPKDPQAVCSLSNICEPKKLQDQYHSQKETNIDTPQKSSLRQYPSSSTYISQGSKFVRSNGFSKTAVPQKKYSVTLEYVLARKNFVECQNISEDQRLNLFPAPMLKPVQKSSLYFKRKTSKPIIYKAQSHRDTNQNQDVL